MKILFGLVFAVVLCVIVQESSVSAGRGARGGSRGGGSRGGSRGGSSRSRSGSTTRKFSRGTSRPTKYTNIPVRAKTSPVIVKQTKVRTRPNLATKVFVGYLFYRYALHTGPVYRHRYPLYRSQVVIPDERAIRVNFTQEDVLDSQGMVCLGLNQTGSIVRNATVTFVNTEVRYAEGNKIKAIHYFGENQTVYIDKSILDQSIQVSTIVKYNGTIIPHTNCTQIRSVMNGTVVRMYATNPDKAGVVSSSVFVVILSCILFFILYK